MQIFNSLSTCILRVLMFAEPNVVNTSSTIINLLCTYTSIQLSGGESGGYQGTNVDFQAGDF